MFFNIHTHHLSNSKDAIELYNQYPLHWNINNNIFSVGVHPMFIKKELIEKELKILKQKISIKKCFAIGEIGLDKLCNVNFDLQIYVFKQQLLIAEEHKIPVIIHCIRAYQEILHIRKTMKITIPFIFHGFNKNEQIVRQILQQNCYVSFGKNLLQNKSLQIIFEKLSPNNFFLENDASEIPIQDIYTFASNIRKQSIKKLKLQQAENWKTVLGYEVLSQ